MDKIVLDGRMNLNMANIGARQTAGTCWKCCAKLFEVESFV